MKKEYKEVHGIKNVEGREKGIWTRIGVGFPNSDGSMNLKFDYLPTNSEITIQLRDPQPQDAAE